MKKFEQFAEQAYSSKAQIDEGLQLLGLGAKAFQYGTRNAPKVFRAVKGLFSKGKPTAGRSAISQRASNVVKDQRLGVHGTMDDLNQLQRSAQSSLDRLGKSRANDATRAATREKNRLNNLDPRRVSANNARDAAAQVKARNERLGRSSFAGPQPVDRLDYKPGDPMFTDHLKRYYAAKRRGDKGLPK